MTCPLCDGNNRGKQRMDACDLCSGTGTLGLLGEALVMLFDGETP